MDEVVRELFRANDRHVTTRQDTLGGLQEGQRPELLTVSCGDSRVLQDGMWDDRPPGHIFTHSNIGNRVRQQTERGKVIAGDVLYPLVHTGTETVLVVGHTGCGAVTAAYRSLTEGIEDRPGIEHCVRLIEDDLSAALDSLPPDISDDEAINRLVEHNVDRQIQHLCESEDVPDAVTAVGVVYDFHDVYSDKRGRAHLVNVDGTHDVSVLESQYPALADRIQRLWTY
ncbi:carbonic anhydrase [Halovenus salina]|uniref:carbonic anhydrase n=1 Tax=Halovenus salina TaxID=1510225 RepID=UPI002260F3B8|nr:carbonic anhydrase [Halovenus salina]